VTSSGRAGKPAGAEQPTGPQPVPGGTVPDSEQELRQDIERTREQVGATVEQLAAKTDVKARARAKATEMAGRMKGKTAQARVKAADRGAGVRSQMAGKAVMARQQAAAGRGQLRTRAAAVGTPVWQAAPEPLRHTLTKGFGTARQHRAPLTIAAAMLIASYQAFQWWRRR